MDGALGPALERSRDRIYVKVTPQPHQYPLTLKVVATGTLIRSQVTMYMMGSTKGGLRPAPNQDVRTS